MQDRHFSDEELVAFLDGEKDYAPMDAIRAALKTDAALAARLDALKLDMAALADSFDLLQAPEFDTASLSAAPLRRAWAGMAVAACLTLAVGFGAGSWNAAKPLEGWVDYVAAYQALYTHATLDHISQTPAQHTVELDRVASVIGKEFSLEQLTTFSEVDYKRAQVLAFEGRPLVQLAFASKTGVPIALCIIRAGGEASMNADSLQTMRLEGLSSAVWSNGDYEYLLIGGTEDGLIERMGQAFQSMEI